MIILGTDDENTSENLVEIYSDDNSLEAVAALYADYAVTPESYEIDKQQQRNFPGYDGEETLYILPYGYRDIMMGWIKEYNIPSTHILIQ